MSPSCETSFELISTTVNSLACNRRILLWLSGCSPLFLIYSWFHIHIFNILLLVTAKPHLDPDGYLHL